MFENFPYTDMHQLNLDWIVKIAKDFLEQYTSLQQMITDGESSLTNLTTEGLERLQNKADQLESLLNQWYTTHSSDIANQLADALADINTTLNTAITNFGTAADAKAAQTIASIPSDYTTVTNDVEKLKIETDGIETSIAGLSIDNDALDLFQLFSDESIYSNVSGNQKTYIPIRKISKGCFIDFVRLKASTVYDSYIYLINAVTHEVIYKKQFTTVIGWNRVDIQFVPNVDVYFAVRTRMYYKTVNGNENFNYSFNEGKGLYEATTTNIYSIGDVIEYTNTAPTSYYCFAFEARVTAKEIKRDYEYLAVSEEKNLFTLFENTSLYDTSTRARTFYLSNRIIPKGSFIKTVSWLGSDNGTANILFINSNNQIVKLFAAVPTVQDTLNEKEINYIAEEDLKVALMANMYYKRSNIVTEETAFNTGFGLYEIPELTSDQFAIGATVTVTQTSTEKFAFYVQVNYEISESINNRIQNESTNIITKVQELNAIKTNWLPRGLQTSGKLLRYVETLGNYTLIGRWYTQNVNGIPCIVTNNCGSEIHFKTNGATSISVMFEAMTETNAYYGVSIDGGSIVRKNITTRTTVLPDAKTHYIRIVTDGITEDIGKWNYGRGFAIASITTNAGEMQAVFPKNPLLMFFGDSITEGIRALGMEDTDMGDVNSATNAFPWFCCEKMKAVSHRVGYGASGITANGSFHKAIDAVDYLYNGLEVTDYFPDGIVINHGTNDSSASSSDFIAGYNSLLDELRAKYPGIKIYAMVPFNQRHAADIVTVGAENPDITVIQTATWTGITYTDGMHPDAAGARVAGEYLADALLSNIYPE